MNEELLYMAMTYTFLITWPFVCYYAIRQNIHLVRIGQDPIDAFMSSGCFVIIWPVIIYFAFGLIPIAIVAGIIFGLYWVMYRIFALFMKKNN